MLGFIEWVEINRKKKANKKKNGEQYCAQGSGEKGNVDHINKVDLSNQEIQSADVHYFPEP